MSLHRRQLVLVVAALSILVAGCSSVSPGGAEEPTAAPTPAATATVTEREPVGPHGTVVPSERLVIVSETNATINVTEWDYVGSDHYSGVVNESSGNWRRITNATYENQSGIFAVTEFVVDGHVTASAAGASSGNRRLHLLST